MEKLVINGGKSLRGSVEINGNFGYNYEFWEF